jgi:hypothetical protein
MCYLRPKSQKMAQMMKRTHAAPMSVLLLIDRASGNDIMATSLEQDQKQDDDDDQRADSYVHGYLPRQSRHQLLPASTSSGEMTSSPMASPATMAMVKSR